jgi:hypothetical protein
MTNFLYNHIACFLTRLKMALKFNPADAQDGLLMYCAQSEDGQGDFTSLAIRDKRLEFRFDTGSGKSIFNLRISFALYVFGSRRHRGGEQSCFIASSTETFVVG